MTVLSTLKTEKSQIEIPLPKKVKLFVKKGENVEKGQLIASGEKDGELKEFDLAKILIVSPKNVGKFLKCSLGSKVTEGQVIAEKKGMLGLRNQIFKSSVSGVLEALTEKGVLKIKTSGKKKEVFSPVKGKINNITPEKAEVEFTGFCLKGSRGFGRRAWGNLKIFKKEEVDLRDLTSELSGSILIIPGKISSGFYHKACALGILGLVAGDVSGGLTFDDLIILLAGEKNGFISEETLNELKQHEGKQAHISGEEKSLITPFEK